MKACFVCGRTEEEGAKFYDRKRTCSRCRRRARKKREADALKGKFPEGSKVFVEWCPHNEYPRGHYFRSMEFYKTLKCGYYTLGMIISVNKKKYTICGHGRSYMALKKMGYPMKCTFPSQWVVVGGGRR